MSIDPVRIAVGGGASAAVVAATTLVPIVIQKIEDAVHAYGREDVLALNRFRELHQEYCSEDPISFTPQEDSQLNEALKTLGSEGSDIYFQMNPEQTYPRMYLITNKKFEPCLEAEKWIRVLQKNHFTDSIEDCIGYICEYQSNRNGFFDRACRYDPTNLFFEEFKVWLVQLSKSAMHDLESVGNAISKRVLYLEKAATGPYFRTAARYKSIEPVTEVVKVISRVIKGLKVKLLPIVEDMQRRECAREHFDQLRLIAKDIAKTVFKLAFYLFRDPIAAPPPSLNFVIEELRNPTLANYKGNEKTVLHAILSYLARTDSLLQVFTPFLVVNETVDSRKPLHGRFLIQNQTLLPRLANHPELVALTVNNFWNVDEKRIKSGFFKPFKTKELMMVFLRCCGLVQQFSLVSVIAAEFYDLAGEGGNILVYRMAASKMHNFLSSLTNFVETVTKELTQLKASVWKYFETQSTSQLSLADQKLFTAWNYDCYYPAFKQFEDLIEGKESLFKKMNGLLETITSALRSASDPRQEEYIKQKIRGLGELLDKFAGKTSSQASPGISNEFQGAAAEVGPSSFTRPSILTPASLPLLVSSTQKPWVFSLDFYRGRLQPSQFNSLEKKLAAPGSCEKYFNLLLLLNPEDKAVVIAFADYLTAKDDRQSKDQALSLLHDLVLNDDVVSNASLILRRAELLFHLGDHDKSQKMLQKILNPSVQPSGGDGGGGDAVSSVDPQPLDSTSVSTARSLMRTVTLFLARGALARADYVEAKTQVNLLMSPNSIDAEARTLRETIKRLSGS